MFLDYLRESMAAKVAGVDESSARRALVPSGTSLYWLTVHLTGAEINWFQRTFAGRDVELPQDEDGTDTAVAALDRYRAACAESRHIVSAAADLGAKATRPDRRGACPPLRWIIVHMIEETARHAGHADILREQLDGVVGR